MSEKKISLFILREKMPDTSGFPFTMQVDAAKSKLDGHIQLYSISA